MPHVLKQGWLALVLAALVLALAWWLRAPMHEMALERDEGAYATIATHWLQGDVLYRDLFDHKPPLIYAVYALALPIPASPVASIRIVATCYLLVSGLALLALGWRLYGQWAAMAALALFVVYASSLRFQGLTFNSEAIMTLPALLMCLLLVVVLQSRRIVLLGAAGIFAALAILAKPVGGALLLPLVLAPLLLPGSWRHRLAGVAVGIGGALLPLLLVGGYLWAVGALPAAQEALIVYNRIYAAESVALILERHLEWMWRIWAPMLVLAVPALLGLAATLTRPAWRTPAHLITAVWGGVLLATALLSLRAFPHYYLAAVPAFCLWAGALLAVAAGWLARRTHWLAALPVGGALLALLLVPPVQEIWPLRSLSPREQIERLYGYEGLVHFWMAGDVADYLAQRVEPDEPVFVWAAEPQIYYLGGLQPFSRFVYDYPVDRLPGARNEVLVALERAPPPFLVTYHAVRPIGFFPFADQHGYRLVANIGGFDLFERVEREEREEQNQARRTRGNSTGMPRSHIGDY